MRQRLNNLTGKDWVKYSISVWSDLAKTSEERKLKHPAMFPAALCERLIDIYTKDPGLTVLDPFVGSGSVGVAAASRGHHFCGFDTNYDYVRLAASRVAAQARETGPINICIHHKDAREMRELVSENSIDLCITSPPYWDILSRKRTIDKKDVDDYGDEAGDLSRIGDYANFLQMLMLVFEEVYHVLKPKGHCIVNVMDLRKKSTFYPYHMDVANFMRSIGFSFEDIIIWDRRSEYNNLGALGYPSVFRVNKVHEYIMIFRKPDEKAIIERERTIQESKATSYTSHVNTDDFIPKDNGDLKAAIEARRGYELARSGEGVRASAVDGQQEGGEEARS